MTTQPTPMHFPIDECAKCTVRGDMGGCLATRCSLHESWYARTQNAELETLRMDYAAARLEIESMRKEHIERN